MLARTFQESSQLFLIIDLVADRKIFLRDCRANLKLPNPSTILRDTQTNKPISFKCAAEFEETLKITRKKF